MPFTKGHTLWKHPNCKKGRFKKGNIPPFKGKKGIHISSKTEFKKGTIPWNKGKQHLQITGNLNPNWKGNKVGYHGVHIWVRKFKGKPKKCEHCGKSFKERKLTWANINHKYRRILKDYIALCYSCHKKYDLKFLATNGISQAISSHASQF